MLRNDELRTTPGAPVVSPVARAATLLGLAALGLVLFPEAAAACPVCFDSSDENRMAFIATTAFLSLMPLGMVAGAGLWIRKKVKDRGDDPVDPNRPEP